MWKSDPLTHNINIGAAMLWYRDGFFSPTLVRVKREYDLHRFKSSLPYEVSFKGQNREVLNDQGPLKSKAH